MRRRGFTLLELAICVSLLGILVPTTYAFIRTFEDRLYRASAVAESARSARAFSEELRRDLQTMQAQAGDRLVLQGACGTVEYAVVDGVLLRKASAACGGDRPIARQAQALTREARAAVLTFGRPMRPGLPAESSFRVAW